MKIICYQFRNQFALLSRLPLSLFATILIVFNVQFLCHPVNGIGASLTGLDIMQQTYAREQADTMISSVEMILVGNDGQQRRRKMATYMKHSPELTKKIVFFRAPADVKGAALLTYDYSSANEEDEQWIYLPALHKSKRISAGNRSGSFMGSDFSYADLTKRELNSFSYKLLKEQRNDQYPVWIVEALPKNKEIIDRYGYSKSLFIISRDNFVIVRAVHWLKNKTTLKYNEITKIEKIENVWVPLEIHAKTVKNGKTIHQTFLINRDVQLNQPVDDQLFTKRRLEQGCKLF